MRYRNARAWMMAEAVEQLHRADRLQRQFFQIGRSGQSPCWEPPVDVYQHGHQLVLLIALPGVASERFEVVLESDAVVVQGERTFGTDLGSGSILRMEIPYGRFERRIYLPEGSYRLSEMLLENGCLKLTLERLP